MKTQSAKSGYFFTYKKAGIKGILDLIDKNSKKDPVIRSLMNFDRKYFALFRFLRHLAKIDAGIGKYGRGPQMTKLIKKLNIKLEIFNNYQNGRIDTTKGLLVYGVNHSAFLEWALLLTILKQKTIRFVANRFYHFMGRFMRENSFPVVARVFNSNQINPIHRYLGLGKRFNEHEGMTDEERKLLNQNSLVKSAKVLERGGVVVIFPGGGGNELNKWRGGLSRIMSNVARENRHDITLVPVYFSGMGKKRTLLRIFKAYRNIKQKPLRVGIYFGREKKLSEIYSMFGEDVREGKILDYLKRDAFGQFGLKEFPLKNYLYPQHYPKALGYGLRFATKILLQIIPFSHLIRS